METAQRPGHVNALLLFTQASSSVCSWRRTLLLFYIFYELTLMPVFFLLLYWGGEQRRAITVRFFMYTLLGGLSLLFGIGLPAGADAAASGDFTRTGRAGPAAGHAVWLFWVAVPGLRHQAADLPLPQLATRDLHHGAPVQGTMVLGCGDAEDGLYGVYKIVFPIVPLGVRTLAATR
jgi:NADH-quinone oxidoreductase subunit M